MQRLKNKEFSICSWRSLHFFLKNWEQYRAIIRVVECLKNTLIARSNWHLKNSLLRNSRVQVLGTFLLTWDIWPFSIVFVSHKTINLKISFLSFLVDCEFHLCVTWQDQIKWFCRPYNSSDLDYAHFWTSIQEMFINKSWLWYKS